MGHLLDGAWTENETLGEIQNGLYVKKPSIFRGWIKAEADSEFPAARGRYHLYAAVSCPWAHRTVLFRVLKKLEPIVALHQVEQQVGGQGWTFARDHIVPGTDRRVRYLHELYTIAEPRCTTRVTVPTLWDAHQRRVVNNESSEIIRMFNAAFGAFAEATPDYYPAPLRAEIDAMNDFVLKGVNNAVNGCGRSSSQAAYEESFHLLFRTLDTLEEKLSRQRYLCGPRQTEADWRLFPNLVRFDPISYQGYKCNLRRIVDYPNLWGFVRDLYQTPGVAPTVHVDFIKRHYYGSHPTINPTRIVPVGPALDYLAPHGRWGLSG